MHLVLAPAPSNLSPEAAELNAKAMQFYDAGQLAPAADEFFAAYQSMPNARRDRAGREQLLGSMRSTLLALHAETGEAAPLCRLQAILKDHAEALTVAWPEDPNMLEARNARARHEEVTKQLAAFGPEACAAPVPAPVPAIAPAPAPVVAPAVEPPRPVPAPAAVTPPPEPVSNTLARKQLIAGSVVLPLGLVALGALGGVASSFRRDIAAADALHADLAQRACTSSDRIRMSELLADVRRERGAMIALGLTGAALVSAGTALLVRGAKQRRRTQLGFDLRHNQVGLTIAGAF
ncbi:hypothetical protein [Nannocystis sp.]|uniref:hypothetical protein n=1 Tax=Nannocystis sp. TaxID=1962667 RepID=UPI0025E4717A|nr:hypothetical protein [Nannocystis sp.]MBK7825027.1 hypothetical protein [Nannocystis sp.]